MTMREYARGETSPLLLRLAQQARLAAESAGADSIHDLRVAIRRLSRCLRVFAQFYPAGSRRKLRQRLRKLMDAAGAVRDLDIAMALLGEAGVPRCTAVLARLAVQRRKRSLALLAEVRRWSGRRLSHVWPRKLESDAAEKTRQAAWNEQASPAANARRVLPRLAQEFFAQVRAALAAHPSPERLHRIRLAAKRMRYTLELFRRCYGRGLESRIERLRSLQQVLGEINDCATTRRLLDGAMPVSPQRARTERFLAARIRQKTAELRRLWSEDIDAPGQELGWAQYLSRNARAPGGGGNTVRAAAKGQ
jgi:CHAD domain-containing protein